MKEVSKVLDLKSIPCPLNVVKCKLSLEKLSQGQTLILYLDKGELLKLTSNRPLHNITTKYLGVDSDSKLLCPGCGSIMDMESVGGVEIDVCLQCNGVWLDSDELEQLKELDSDDIEKLSPEKLAELYDANKAVPTSGILSWLFGR